MSAAVALAILQTSADDDLGAAFAAMPSASRHVVRPPELAGAPLPPDATAVTTEWRDRADAARLVQRATGAHAVVVLAANEWPDTALASALTALATAPSGVRRARRRHRFLGGDVDGAPLAIAWCGDAAVADRARPLDGTLLALESDVATTIARLDLAAARAAAGVRGPVPIADFVRRPAVSLVQRLWMRRRDGVPGVILSLIESYGEVLAAAKRWERRALREQHLTNPGGVRLPRGFVALKTPAGWMVVRRDVDERLLAALSEATPDAPAGEPIAAAGRGGAFLVAIGDGRRAVLRWYLRGGAVRRVLRDRYLGWRPRPILELALTEEARRRGIATAEVLGVRVDRTGPGVYRGVIVTEAIEHATTLADVLRAPLGDGERTAILDAVAGAVRLMHERGVHHRDLNAGNVLVVRDRGALTVHLIDFDRAQIRGKVSERVRRRALRRLDRSLAKLNRECDVVSAAERAYLANAYWERA